MAVDRTIGKLPIPSLGSKTRNSQPQDSSGSGSDHSLVSLCVPSGPKWFDHFTGLAWTVNNIGSLTASVCPVGKSVLNSGNGYFSRANPATTGPLTVSIIYTPTTVSGVHGIWSMSSTFEDGVPAILLQRDGANVRMFVNSYVNTFNGIAVVGRPLHLVVSISDITPGVAGAVVVLAINGVASAATVTQSTAIPNEFLGSGYAGQAAGHYSLYARQRRYLGTIGAAKLSENPWQLFKGRKQLAPGALNAQDKPPARASRMLGTSTPASKSLTSVTGTRAVCTQQPQQPVGVNWANPITRGLVLLTSGLDGVELVRNISPTYIGTPAKVVGMGGKSTKYDKSTAFYYQRHTSLEPANAVSFGYFGCRGTATFIDSYARPMGKTTNNAGSPYLSYDMEINPGGGQDTINLNLRTGSIYSATGTGVSLMLPHVNLGTWDNTSGLLTLYQNGKQLAQTSGVTGTISYDTTSTGNFIIGSGSSAGILYPFYGDIYVAAVWNRRLSASEALSFSQNPWQVFLSNNSLPPMNV